MRLIAATNNSAKLAELERILTSFGIEAFGLKESGINIEIIENGKSFAENAIIKAKTIHNLTGEAVIADDSGLCVDALNGRPGVYSARYMGEDTPYPLKMDALLAELAGVQTEARRAQFVSAIAFITAAGEVYTFEGICQGSIGYQPIGENGFGYDPIFMVNGQSFAQLDDGEKDRISHRGAALKMLSLKMNEILNEV